MLKLILLGISESSLSESQSSTTYSRTLSSFLTLKFIFLVILDFILGLTWPSQVYLVLRRNRLLLGFLTESMLIQKGRFVSEYYLGVNFNLYLIELYLGLNYLHSQRFILLAQCCSLLAILGYFPSSASHTQALSLTISTCSHYSSFYIIINFNTPYQQYYNLSVKIGSLMIQRRKTIDIERKPKVNLPAALFNRASETEENNASLSNFSSFDNVKCENHPTKKGKYCVVSEEEEDQIFYCQKCAILLASQGFKVSRLEEEQLSERDLKSDRELRSERELKSDRKMKRKPVSREQELQQFLQVLDKKHLQIEKEKQDSLMMTKNIQIWEEQSQEKIEMFFHQVLSMIDRQKEKYYAIVEVKKAKMEQEIKKQLRSLEEQSINVQQMKEDIESAYESIVRQTPDDDYNLVMGHYKNNVTDLKFPKTDFDNSYPLLPNLGQLEGSIEDLFDADNIPHSQNPLYCD